MKGKLLIIILITFLVLGCSITSRYTDTPSTESDENINTSFVSSATRTVTETIVPTETSTQVVQPTNTTAAPTATFTPTPTQIVLGPENYSPGINPLTGLPVENPDNLALPPALISITNFPLSSRPQAGLSYASLVFELYIGEGMTRYLALFYGDFPQEVSEGGSSGTVTDNAMVGPIRSGRMPYEDIRQLFNGFLVMASGSSEVVPNLSQYANVYGSDADNVNSALIDVKQLEKIAGDNQKRLQDRQLQGNYFSDQVPENGVNGHRIWLMYAFRNQIDWKYEKTSGAYHRYQDNADGLTFTQMTDRLNGDPLTFENVVILFAPHEVISPTIIDVNLMYMKKMPALLFRDGKMYKIFWTTISEDYEKETGALRPIRFIDENGNPFPLKPGQTWVEIVQQFTPYHEVPDSDVFYDLANKEEPGSGVWAVRWYPPQGAK